MKRLFLLLAFLLPLSAVAQTHTFPATDTNNTFTGTNTFTKPVVLGPFTIAAGPTHLPSAVTSGSGATAIVTDGATSSDCTTGAGSFLVICVSNGATWQAGSSGGGNFMSNGSNCFASYYGNDANDGLSWGTAKEAIMSCYDDVIPSTGGTIYFADGGGEATAVKSSADPTCGIRLAGSGDPNYGHLPVCWHQVKPVSFIGQPGNGTVTTILAGSQADNNHPAIWLSGTSQSLLFSYLAYKYPNVGIRIGCNSNNNCSDGTGGVSGATFYNVNGHINQVAGAGPDVRIGSNSFWDLFLYSAFSGNSAEQVPVASFSRTNGVVTVTTSSDFTVIQYQHLGVVNATDESFNGSYQVASVIDPTHFTIANVGPNVSATDFDGTVITDKQIPIVEDPWDDNTQGAGSGQIYVEHQQGGSQYSSGGVRMWPGMNGGGIYVTSINPEGNGGGFAVAPGVWVVISSVPEFVNATNIEMSDCTGICPAVRVDVLPGVLASRVANEVVTDRVQGTVGPASTIGSYLDPLIETHTPLSEGQFGFYSGQISGQTDAGRRMFSPSALPHGKINLANTDSTTWTTAGGTPTTPILAPDGTSNAAQIAGVGGSLVISGGSITPATGDKFIFGAWVRSATGNGYAGASAIRFDTNANGFGGGNICMPSGGAQTGLLERLQGDGQWEYFSGICDLVSYGGNFAGLQIIISSSSTQTAQVYAPSILWFTSGQISTNEAYEIANNLSFAPTNCPSGAVCMMPTQKLGIGGSTQFMGLLTHGNTANRTYTFPNVSGTASLAAVQYCGATSGGTQACANTVQTLPIIVWGDVTLNTASSQSITSLPFSGTTYSCSGSDLTNVAGIVSFNTYMSASVTIAESGGGTSDHLRYQCVGN